VEIDPSSSWSMGSREKLMKGNGSGKRDWEE
jgi:hypothetical protein